MNSEWNEDNITLTRGVPSEGNHVNSNGVIGNRVNVGNSGSISVVTQPNISSTTVLPNSIIRSDSVTSKWVDDIETNPVTSNYPIFNSTYIKREEKEDNNIKPITRDELIRTLIKKEGLPSDNPYLPFTVELARNNLKKPLENKLIKSIEHIESKIRFHSSSGDGSFSITYPYGDKYDSDFVSVIKSYFTLNGYTISSETKEDRYIVFNIKWI